MEHSPKIVKQALNWLTESGYLYRRNNPDQPWDKCYQYQINVALVQSKITLMIRESQQKMAETQRNEIVPLALSSTPVALSIYPTAPAYIRSSLDLFEDPVSIQEGKAIQKDCSHVSEFEKKSIARNEWLADLYELESTGEPKDERLAATTEIKTDTLTNGKVNQEESIAPPRKFFTEIINGRVWNFYRSCGKVQLPQGSKNKLARSLAHRGLQMWLVNQLVERDEWRLVITPQNKVWAYDSLDGIWMEEREIYTIAKLWGLAYNHLGILSVEQYNDTAINYFEQISERLSQIPKDIKRVAIGEVIRFFEVPFESVEWEDPDCENVAEEDEGEDAYAELPF